MRKLLAPTFCAVLLALGASRPALAGSAPFIVFFPHDSSRLEPDALAILECAAEAKGEFKIAIHAGADRSGSADYNLELSRRRALAVKAALIGWGLRPEHVTVKSFGEGRPLVGTPDGIQERRNRYAFIEVLAHVESAERQNVITARCPLKRPVTGHDG